VVVNTHYLPQQVEAFVKSSPWADRVDLSHEEALLGTAGTLRLHREYFGEAPLLLAHADHLKLFSLPEFQHAYLTRPEEGFGTMMTFQTNSPQSCGVVKLDNRGVLSEYYEKVNNPPGNVANAAVFFAENTVLERLNEYPMLSDFCGDFIPLFLNKVQTYHNDIYHRDIGTIASLEKANEDFSKIRKNL
jgi:mannose-1-phosphate guanylyltransferase